MTKALKRNQISRISASGRFVATYAVETLKPVTKKGNITMAQADRAVREVLARKSK